MLRPYGKTQAPLSAQRQRTYVAPRSRTRVNCDDYTALKPESKRSSAMLNFDSAIRVCMVVRQLS